MNRYFIARPWAASTGAAAFAAAGVLATLNPATAHAEFTGDFTSPGGDVYCQMSVYDEGTGAVACEGGGPYAASKPECASHSAWGDRFYLKQGEAAVAQCHNDTIRSNQPLAPVLDYGQTQSLSTSTCDSRPSGIACTDVSSGHFITLSAESNSLG